MTQEHFETIVTLCGLIVLLAYFGMFVYWLAAR
jgi:hypothetical protein